MIAVEGILAMAAKHEAAALEVIERGERDGFDATDAALEQADIARGMRLAAAEMVHMDGAAQQEYAHRLRAALWARLDDSPVTVDHREEHP